MQEDLGNLTPAEREVERALAGLTLPTPPDGREAIAYEAGYRVGARRSRVMWGTTSGMLAACLAVSLGLRSGMPATDAHVARAPVVMAVAEAPPSFALPERPFPPAGNYLAVRETVLAGGLDALPSPAGGSAGDAPPRAINIRSVTFPTLFGGRS